MRRISNLDTATAGTLRTEARDAVLAFLEEWDQRMIPENWMQEYEEVKVRFAELIGANPEEITGVPNVSTASGIVADALHLGPRTAVVTTDMEPPSNYYPWVRSRRRGATVRTVESRDYVLEVDDLEDEIDDQTVIVAVSHVSPVSGSRLDLRELCRSAHRLGALVYADCSQSVGAISIDVKDFGVDLLAAGSETWLSSLPGAGFMYVSPSIVGGLHSPLSGWLGHSDPSPVGHGDYVEAAGARRFETGTPNVLGYVSVGAVLERISQTGMDEIAERVLSLTGWLIEELVDLGFDVVTPTAREARAGIVTFVVDDPSVVSSRLLERGVKVSHTRAGVRVSVHHTNTESEVKELLGHLREMRARR